MIIASSMREDWQQFRRLGRGSARRFLNTISGSADADPIPFVIWAAALALTPPLLTAIRNAFRLGMTGDATPGAVLAFVQGFRAFYIVYAMLMTLIATTMIWDALLPNRDDQEIVGALPVRPVVVAAARLAAGCRVMLALSLGLAVPVALIFGSASSAQTLVGPLPRVLAAHVLTIVCASSTVFFTLVAVRAAVAACGGERLADHLASALQLIAVLVFVETFLFLPGLLFDLLRTIRQGGPVPAWYAMPLWFSALYGWIAEGGAPTRDAEAALLVTAVPALAALALTLLPAGRVARKAQESLASHGASIVTSLVKGVLAIVSPGAAVAGMTVFAAATLARSRRHAVIVASYGGLAIAMATVELLTAGFTNRFNLAAPRQDSLAVPLVCLFFAVFGLRTALSRPADAAANWPFRIAPPRMRDCRRAARLVVLMFGVMPVLAVTFATSLILWPPATAVAVTLLDTAAAILLVEMAFSGWTRVPCATLQAAATDTVKSRWPMQVLVLYLFAFRGADLEMLALRRDNGVAIAVVMIAATVVALRLRERVRLRTEVPTLDVADDGPLLLQLSEAESHGAV